jgi:hypothetical protein
MTPHIISAEATKLVNLGLSAPTLCGSWTEKPVVGSAAEIDSCHLCIRNLTNEAERTKYEEQVSALLDKSSLGLVRG